MKTQVNIKGFQLLPSGKIAEVQKNQTVYETDKTFEVWTKRENIDVLLCRISKRKIGFVFEN